MYRTYEDMVKDADAVSEYGVLGPTNCPLCKRLRKDPAFVVLWSLLIAAGLYVAVKLEAGE